MIEREEFDVLIVGAGPAGSHAAEKLARRGASVALFDGRPTGEPKACGGGVTSKALKAWPHLLEACGRTVEEVEMFSPSGSSIKLKLTEPFVIYSRSALDSFLCERARRAGAQVFRERVAPLWDGEGDVWTVRSRDGERWRGRLLVAADGANSSIARRLAGAIPTSEMEVAFGYRAPLPQADDAPTVIAFLPGWMGYAWAFPRLDHVSFGIATAQDAFDHAALDQLLWCFMRGYYRRRSERDAPLWSSLKNSSTPLTAIEVANKIERASAEEDIERKLRTTVERYAARIPGLSPDTWNMRRACGGNWALLGDAAGFADPVTGEGIYYAMRSAELFAESYLSGRTSAYEDRWREDFGRDLQRAAQMRRRFYGRFYGAPFTERMIDLARLHAGVRRTLRELVAGDQGYLDLKGTLARRALWPF